MKRQSGANSGCYAARPIAIDDARCAQQRPPNRRAFADCKVMLFLYKKIISMHRNSMSVVDVVFNLSPSVSLCLSCQASSNLLIPPSRRMNFSFHHRRSNLIVNLFIFV